MNDEIKMNYLDPESPLHEGMQNRIWVTRKYAAECLDAIPSEECKEYHKNSCIQINYQGKSHFVKCDAIPSQD